MFWRHYAVGFLLAALMESNQWQRLLVLMGKSSEARSLIQLLSLSFLNWSSTLRVPIFSAILALFSHTGVPCSYSSLIQWPITSCTCAFRPLASTGPPIRSLRSRVSAAVQGVKHSVWITSIWWRLDSQIQLTNHQVYFFIFINTWIRMWKRSRYSQFIKDWKRHSRRY